MYKLKKLPNGFEYIEIKNSSASAKIALNGAHIFHYQQTTKEPLLWLSEISDFENEKSIRGGIPICWPWFGMNKNENLPQHGFARMSLFELTNISELAPNNTQVSFILKDTQESRKLWPYSFILEYTLTVSDKLSLELKTTNKDSKDFKITQALHSYFKISDILDVAIIGLDKKPYLDALTMKDGIQDGKISFDTEVDRIYKEVDSKINLIDKDKIISIENKGSSSTVVWNPWIDKCLRMSAMKGDAYKRFVCIESANALDDFKIIKPNQTHTLKATVY